MTVTVPYLNDADKTLQFTFFGILALEGIEPSINL
jgi:hypothetical protein